MKLIKTLIEVNILVLISRDDEHQFDQELRFVFVEMILILRLRLLSLKKSSNEFKNFDESTTDYPNSHSSSNRI